MPAQSSSNRSRSRSPSVDLTFILADEDQTDSPSSSAQRQRASAACLQCRRLKSKCRRTSDGACERCAALNIECEVVKSRRGRVLGSRKWGTVMTELTKSKRTGLEKSVAHVQAALDRIRKSALSPTAKAEQVALKEEELEAAQRRPKRARISTSPEAEVEPSFSAHNSPPSPYHADLVVDSARVSPDPAEHPLRVLSDVGSSLPAASVGWTVPGWTPQQLAKASASRRLYFRHRPGAAKRDIAPVLDPIVRGVVTEERAEELLAIFLDHMAPQPGFMDRKIHTLANLRARSALLTTSVLCAAALSTEKDRGKLERLYAHADAVHMTVVARNAKSQEIVLALIIMMLWPMAPDRIVDDSSRMLLVLAINMALELGMNRMTTIEGDEDAQRWHRDRTRTWCSLVIQDRSLAATSGKPPMIHEFPDAASMRRWMDNPLATHGDRMVVGYLELRKIEMDAREQLKRTPRAYMIDGVRLGVKVILRQWVREWVTPELAAFDKTSVWIKPMNMMHVLAHHIYLLITTASNAAPEVVVETARNNLTFVLEAFGKRMEHILRTVCGMIAWAAVLLLRLDRANSTELVKAIALSMAPNGDGPPSYAQFYGSFLLGLCLEQPLDPSGTSISPSSLMSGASGPSSSLQVPPQSALVSTYALHANLPRTGVMYSAPPMEEAQLPVLAPGHAPLQGGHGHGDLGLSNALLFEDLPFELPWDMPAPEQVAPTLDWVLNDNTEAGDSALWGFGSEWGGNGWNVDLTTFRAGV